MIVALVAACAALVAATVALEHRGHPRASLAAKVGASSCFVALALWRPMVDSAWTLAIGVGLLLGMLGDVALALPGRRAFLAGLVSFLLGHVLYVLAFANVATAWGRPEQLLPVLASAGAIGWLWPHAAGMRGAVLAYVVVITAMVVAALAAAPALPPATARAVVAGSLLFYASDLLVARQRFVTPGLLNRAVGLPLYYAGQLLIAWSIGMS